MRQGAPSPVVRQHSTYRQMDATQNNAWRLVQLTVGGVYEYQFTCSRQYPYFILSDGLNIDCTSRQCVLDLDQGPDDWATSQVGQRGEYSQQYVIGTWCEYDVSDGPFIEERTPADPKCITHLTKTEGALDRGRVNISASGAEQRRSASNNARSCRKKKNARCRGGLGDPLDY